MKKPKPKGHDAFLKALKGHVKGDIKGFKNEIKEDKELLKGSKKKYSPKKVKKHLKEDMKYYKKELDQDKKILRNMCPSCKKKKNK